MSSKFTDRLKRLHESRVRALDTEEPDQPRVFTAEVEETPVVAPSPPVRRAPVQEVAPAAPTLALDDARREQLERQQRLSARSKPRKLVMQKRDEPQVAATATPSAPTNPRTSAPRRQSGNAIGERLGDLRIQASALIAAGRLESALPLLHEMVSLSPANPYPLAELAKYYRACQMHEFADFYEGRLRAVAPY